MKQLTVCETDSPIGKLTMVAKGEKLILIKFGTWQENKEIITHWCRKHKLPQKFDFDDNPFELIKTQLQNYFLGNSHTFTIDYELHGTPFQLKVWNKLAEFAKYGETRSYQDLAIAIDSPKAVRAIGGAMNKNPISIIIPCHRVIGKNKQLVGYGGGLDKKTYLLNLEKEINHMRRE
ncbi:O-6-methylguanine DNA methyltransferase [Gracilibacillus halotolerans]|uniref:methylated-DNA--[protein]-cysteine S-methyltransferase n=1 Tax=Gracilibacillus halotolerans TaxID=74386 RepID=A0A841RML0_9BACI|nr:methylated-DNA--[protein]-cysteine S-methyltransferase [Gracilibacillus halotolerans]MBB6512164.1 O-6-methylguanine DNA methyltransferase [Gracilibacillus halotolerans]